MTPERWKAIPGWEGLYEASDQGRIRSLDRVVKRRDGKERFSPGRVLSPAARNSGHLYVCLHDTAGSQRTYYVHRLVMCSFVGPRPDGLEVCHWNDVPTDNRLVNLRYGTRSENKHDSVRNRVHNQVKKTHCPRGHELTSPNLTPSGKRAGRRRCLACARARSRVHHYPELKGSFNAIADNYYAEIHDETREVAA